MRNFISRIFIIVIVIAAGAGGYVVGMHYTPKTFSSCPGAAHYTLINPRSVCEGNAVINKANFFVFQQGLEALLAEEKERGTIESASVFFRDLRAGPTFGVNELEEFIPASLLKLPLAIAYLRLSEESPELLSTVLSFSRVPDANATSTFVQIHAPTRAAEKGKEYTIEELLFLTMAYSDNISLGVLHEYLGKLPGGQQALFNTYRELGFIDPKDPYNDSAINAHTYGSIFRILYNASYLNSSSSEKLLSWLAQSDFDAGLEAGVPSETVVAHKFGERLLDTGLSQVHDCGVIYYPENPYLLCVMTRGSDMSELTKVVARVSELVYQEIVSRQRQ